MSYSLKCYRFESIILFGKYRNMRVKDIVDINPAYIEWCIINLDHFYLSLETIKQIQNNFTFFCKTDKLKKKIREKQEEWENNNIYEPAPERESYGYYAGSYAQDIEVLSDDFIDNVLDGRPDAYWNID